MVHLEHAPAARRAVVRAVWFTRLALFAEANLAIAFYCEGCRFGLSGLRQRQQAVAVVVCR